MGRKRMSVTKRSATRRNRKPWVDREGRRRITNLIESALTFLRTLTPDKTSREVQIEGVTGQLYRKFGKTDGSHLVYRLKGLGFLGPGKQVGRNRKMFTVIFHPYVIVPDGEIRRRHVMGTPEPRTRTKRRKSEPQETLRASEIIEIMAHIYEANMTIQRLQVLLGQCGLVASINEKGAVSVTNLP
ncbi:MAG: hypothetical protein V1778_01880 [bacterium]